MAGVKYPLGIRVKHKTLHEIYGFGTVMRHVYDPNAQLYVHVIESDGGHEWFAFGHNLEEVYA